MAGGYNGVGISQGKKNRVGRVLSFSKVVGVGTPPTPHPQVSGAPPLTGYMGRGTLAGERGGGRVPIPTRGHTLWYSFVHCGKKPHNFSSTMTT